MLSSAGEFQLRTWARRLLWEAMVQMHQCDFLLAFGADRLTEGMLRKWLEIVNDVHGPKGAREGWRICLLQPDTLLTFVCLDPVIGPKSWWRDLTLTWPTDPKTGELTVIEPKPRKKKNGGEQ